jgi:large subunit ribosomal protein L11
VNPGQFVQAFNERTRELNGKVVGCLITVYEDRSFDFEIKSSPASVLIKEAARIEKGSGEPHTNKVGKITMDQCRTIAEEKMEDLNAHTIDAGALIIAGTARSMGVDVEGN